MKWLYKKQQKGFTLIETLVSIFIFSVALVGLGSIAARGVSGTRGAANEIIAQYLALEGIEVVRHIRDSNYARAWGTPGVGWTDGLLDACPDTCTVRYNASGSPAYMELVPCEDNECRVSFQEETNLYSFGQGTPTPFIRKISFESISPTEIIVSSQVDWMQGRVERFTTTKEILTHWQNLGI